MPHTPHGRRWHLNRCEFPSLQQLLTQNDLETLTTGFQKVVFPNSYNRCRIYRHDLFVNVVSEDMGVKLEESQMVTIELVN